MANTKLQARKRRKISIRKRMQGTPERPRLSVFRSARHIYAQLIVDTENKVLASASTISKNDREAVAGKPKLGQAAVIGERMAQACLDQGVEKVVFDRNGFRFHGRIKALADAARKKGLSF